MAAKSRELRKLLSWITLEADVMIDAHAQATGRDRSEVARDVLHAWALEQLRISNIAQAGLRSEGIERSDEVASGPIVKLRPTSQGGGA